MKPFNLFVYGTLMNRDVFRAVLGRELVYDPTEADGDWSFHTRSAVLAGYKKVSPDNSYLYAVPDPHGRIRGYLIGPLPGECMSALRRFEGRNYRRKRVHVQTSEGRVAAFAFLGNIEQMTHSFGYQFRDPFKQEILLEAKIDAAIREAEHRQVHRDERSSRQAVRELRGTTIRDIVRRHFEAGGVSDYAIRHSIMDDPLPDFARIADDPAALTVAPNYLAMVVRQVVFNEIEDRLRREFRYELDQMGSPSEYYDRTISSLTALRVLNSSADCLDAVVRHCLDELSFPSDHLIDFVNSAVRASDSLYDPRRVKTEIQHIRNHRGLGHVPMGAELEFSNIGHGVIRDPQAKTVKDPQYDGFFYFYDFALDVLTWKLGGHIDDHRKKALAKPRRGFFEVALGSLSIEANLSRPITNDPWILNQFIHAARRFYQIRPHSVHISLQLRTRHRPVRQRLLPLPIVKCLFAIAGDPARGKDGKVRINRLVSDEIITSHPLPGMMFSEISRRRSSDTDETPVGRTDRAGDRYIQQFKFLRLSPELNYEPIAVALKGLQLKFSPGTFLKPDYYKSDPKHRELYEDLIAWGAGPGPIERAETDAFLEAVADGLEKERHPRPVYSDAYVAWSLNELREMIEKFNALFGPTD